VFSDGQVIYFNPFYFKNGNTAKPKYFVVLKSINNTTLVASLPTRSDKVPSFITKAHGCLNDNSRCFNCYMFEQGKAVCTNGFCFPLDCFIYGNEVEDYEVSIFQSVYPIPNVDYEIKGQLTTTEFQALLQCLQISTSIKRKIKKLLFPST